MLDVETALTAAVKSGALIRHKVALEAGELGKRRIWIRPEVDAHLRSGKLDPRQAEIVWAAFKRFVTSGNFTVVTAECQYQEVTALGDIKQLKSGHPPFVEMRLKPPKQDLRLFGRFVGEDALVVTTFGMKSLTDKTGQKGFWCQRSARAAMQFLKQPGSRSIGCHPT